MKDEMLEAYGRQKLDEIRYWVYVLRCDGRFHADTYDELERKTRKRLGRVPAWLRPAWEHPRQAYIGQTENLEKRLGEHFKNKRSSEFTEVFEPYAIEHLEPSTSRQGAERREKKIGESYYDNNRVFAYWK